MVLVYWSFYLVTLTMRDDLPFLLLIGSVNSFPSYWNWQQIPQLYVLQYLFNLKAVVDQPLDRCLRSMTSEMEKMPSLRGLNISPSIIICLAAKTNFSFLSTDLTIL